MSTDPLGFVPVLNPSTGLNFSHLLNSPEETSSSCTVEASSSSSSVPCQAEEQGSTQHQSSLVEPEIQPSGDAAASESERENEGSVKTDESRNANDISTCPAATETGTSGTAVEVEVQDSKPLESVSQPAQPSDTWEFDLKNPSQRRPKRIGTLSYGENLWFDAHQNWMCKKALAISNTASVSATNTDNSVTGTIAGPSHMDASSGKPVFLFGNYDAYYGYRKKDTRIEAVKKWFNMKPESKTSDDSSQPFRILDVGCNSGQVTNEIGQAFPTSRVLGVDVDSGLVARAWQWYGNSSGSEDSSNVFFENANVAELGPENAILTDFVRRTSPTKSVNKASAASSFRLIFALSVSKWIHFQYGDAGIKCFFDLVHGLLDSDSPTTDSYFILEPQPWKSYKKKRRLSKAIDATVAGIQVHPGGGFRKWLEGDTGDVKKNSVCEDAQEDADGVQEVADGPDSKKRRTTDDAEVLDSQHPSKGGFELVHTIKASQLEGFERDVFIYRKRRTKPPHE